jgi:hypothetical protein
MRFVSLTKLSSMRQLAGIRNITKNFFAVYIYELTSFAVTEDLFRVVHECISFYDVRVINNQN